MVRLLVFLLLLLPLKICDAFLPTTTSLRTTSRKIFFVKKTAAVTDNTIAFQSDDKHYGRGEFHLSADIDEGDIVVYQTGTWYVDGVEVGDGSPADWKLAKMETIQVVWTHNCEHGVLRGYAVKLFDDDCDQSTIVYDTSENGDLEVVEFGPEQLVARLPVEWDDSIDQGISQMKLDPYLWRIQEEDS